MSADVILGIAFLAAAHISVGVGMALICENSSTALRRAAFLGGIVSFVALVVVMLWIAIRHAWTGK